MVSTLKEISATHNFHYKEKNEKYDLSFDIRNLPMKTVTLSKVGECFSISISCIFLFGTSQVPSFSSGNTPDQYRCHFYCEFIADVNSFDFSIEESGFLRKIFQKTKYKISCKDKLTCKFLGENNSLEALYSRCNESAEFSPSIRCYKKDEKTILTINFQTFDSNVDLLKESIDFSYQLMEFYTLKTND